jgi:glycosyltransferase involved in cell wall biosynthesis
VELANGLCGAQKRQGHDVTVLATNLDWDTVLDVPLARPVSIGDIDVEYFPIDGWTLRMPIPTIRRFAVSSRLHRELRERVSQFDIVHVHAIYLYPSLVACASSRKAKVPYVISPYGNLDPVTHSHRRLIKNIYLAMFERRDLNGAAAIHFMSEGERRLAGSFITTLRSRVINLGLPPEKFASLPHAGTFRARHPELSKKRLIMYLGRISYSKGLDLLAVAFSVVAKTQPDAHMVFVGPDHEDYGKVVRRILREHGVENRATFTGMVPEQEKLAALVDADVFVFPSYTEGFGLAMLEAMACGTPVVLSDRASLAPELAAAHAVLTTELRPESIAAAIERLLTDHSEAERLVRTAHELVADRFIWPVVADKFIDLYQDCIESARFVANRPTK